MYFLNIEKIENLYVDALIIFIYKKHVFVEF